MQELAVKGPERERLMAAVDGAVPVACNVGFITEKRHKWVFTLLLWCQGSLCMVALTSARRLL